MSKTAIVAALVLVAGLVAQAGAAPLYSNTPILTDGFESYPVNATINTVWPKTYAGNTNWPAMVVDSGSPTPPLGMGPPAQMHGGSQGFRCNNLYNSLDPAPFNRPENSWHTFGVGEPGGAGTAAAGLSNLTGYYAEAWVYTGTIVTDTGGRRAASGLNGAFVTVLGGGSSFQANEFYIGSVGWSAGGAAPNPSLVTDHFQVATKYGVNWYYTGNSTAGARWGDTGLAIPENQWVKMSIESWFTGTAGADGSMVRMAIEWDTTGDGVEDVQWERSASIDSTIGGSYLKGVQLGKIGSLVNNSTTYFDDVMVAIPEPATLLLMLIGLFGLRVRKVRGRLPACSGPAPGLSRDLLGAGSAHGGIGHPFRPARSGTGPAPAVRDTGV
jgi:hypothetical protein